MSHLFFNLFKLKTSNTVVVFGDKLKSALIQQLSEESVKSGFHSLIVSLIPSTYPVEGKVLVSDDTSILPNLINGDRPRDIYLASKVKNDLLHPFSYKEINRLAVNAGENVRLFVNIGSNNDKMINRLKFLDSSLLVCSINFNLLRENLPDISKLKEQKRKSLSDQVADKVFAVINKNCSHFVSLDSNSNKICFIGQVKGMYDENVILPVARKLKTMINSRILIGNINANQLKEI